MQITRITATAGRTLPHPTEQFANVRSDITLHADLEPGDDAAKCTQQLQCQAEQLVENHAAVLLASISDRKVRQDEADEIQRLERSVADEIQRLERSVAGGHQRLEELKGRAMQRQTQPTLFDAGPPAPEQDEGFSQPDDEDGTEY